jgi:hypothetical protein
VGPNPNQILPQNFLADFTAETGLVPVGFLGFETLHGEDMVPAGLAHLLLLLNRRRRALKRKKILIFLTSWSLSIFASTNIWHLPVLP